MTQHIIDTDETIYPKMCEAVGILALKIHDNVDDYKNTEIGKALNSVQDVFDEWRELLIANSPQADDGMVALALNNTAIQKRVAVLEDLLSSAYNIANRNGENTHWERFAGQLHINGIRPITAKTFKILPSDTDYKPQADGMVLVPTEPTKEMMEAVWIAYLNRQGDIDFEESAIDFYKAMLSAYKPQADDVRKDAWISVDNPPKCKHEDTELNLMASDSLLITGLDISGGKGGIGVGHYFSNGDWICYNAEFDCMNIETITHWQPLPAPPAIDKARE